MTDNQNEIKMEQMVYDAAQGVQAALKKHTGYLFSDGEHEATSEFLYDLFAKYRKEFKD